MGDMEQKLSENLQWLIRNKRLTERELAEEAGASQGYINKLKNGKVGLNVLQVLIRIADRFEITLDDLIHRQMDAQNNEQVEDQEGRVKVLVMRETRYGLQPEFVEISRGRLLEIKGE